MKTIATIITFALSILPLIGGEIWEDAETGLLIDIPKNWNQHETVIETNKANFSSPDENIYIFVSVVPLDTSIPDAKSLGRMRNRIVETRKSNVIRDEDFELNGLNGKLLEHQYSLEGLAIHSIQRFIIGHERSIVIEISGLGVDPNDYPAVKTLQDSIRFSANTQIEAPVYYGSPKIAADITVVILLVAVVIVIIRPSTKCRAHGAANKASHSSSDLPESK